MTSSTILDSIWLAGSRFSRGITVTGLSITLLTACERPMFAPCLNRSLTVISAITDTALAVGRTARLRTVIHNECTEQVTPTYWSDSGAVVVNADGRVIGVQPGRAEIYAQVGRKVVASTWISVVPIGRLSVVLFDIPIGRLISIDLDGSNLTEISRGDLDLNAAVIDWSRDRTQIAISTWQGGSPTTYFRSRSEAFRRLIPEPDSAGLVGPVFSPDAAYIYGYGAFRSLVGRINVATQQVDTLLTSRLEGYLSATLSHDGNRLAILALDGNLK